MPGISSGVTALIALVLGQIVSGVVFLLGYMPLVRRSIDKEIPGELAKINGSLTQLHNEIDRLQNSFFEFREKYARTSGEIESRIRALEKNDDSGNNSRRQPR